MAMEIGAAARGSSPTVREGVASVTELSAPSLTVGPLPQSRTAQHFHHRVMYQPVACEDFWCVDIKRTPVEITDSSARFLDQ